MSWSLRRDATDGGESIATRGPEASARREARKAGTTPALRRVTAVVDLGLVEMPLLQPAKPMAQAANP